MRIYGNEKLISSRKKAEELQDKYVSELDALNIQYAPEFAHNKKNIENRLYITGCCICLLIFVIFLTLIGPAKDSLYLVLILNGVSLGLIIASAIWTLKAKKAYRILKEEWDKVHKTILKYKEEADSYLKDAQEEVIKTIALTLYREQLDSFQKDKSEKKYQQYFQNLLEKIRSQIISELSKNATPDEYLRYYDRWGQEVTSESKDDYDYLEARRKKAFLYAKDKKE